MFAAGLLWFIWSYGLIDMGAFAGLADHPYRLAAAFLAVSLLIPITSFRWFLLLNDETIRFRFRTVFAINYIGVFFNTVLPGGLGGDLFKSVLIFRLSEAHRLRAVLSVIVDRVCGLFGLLIVCTVGILSSWSRIVEHPLLLSLSSFVLVALVAGLGGLILALSLHAPLRRGLATLAATYPNRITVLLISVMDAIGGYRRRYLIWPACIGLSVVLHSSTVVFLYLLAPALGLGGAAFGDFLTSLSLANFANLVPLTPGGIGIGETAYGQLMGTLGNAQDIASFTFQYLLLRGAWVLLSLPGLVIYVLYKQK